MSCRAVIFDLDGTLLDTLDDLTAAVSHALASLGRGGLDRAVVRGLVGNGVKKLVSRALNLTAGRDVEADDRPDGFEKCLAAFTEYYDMHNADSTRLYGGIAELLQSLKSAGIKTAVVTNKYDGASQILKARFFPSVDFVVGTRQGVRPKPAPDGVLLALDALGVAAEDCLYVGDGETDMETAKNCGLRAVAVTWGFRDRALLESLCPYRIIDEPSELTELISEG